MSCYEYLLSKNIPAEEIKKTWVDVKRLHAWSYEAVFKQIRAESVLKY